MKNNQDLNKVTNLDYLIELSKGNTEFVADMIEIFLIENPEELRWLEQGIDLADFDLIKTAAHKMRSTIPFVGLDKHIEQDVIEIELLATRQTGIREIKILFLKIKALCHKASQELRN